MTMLLPEKGEQGKTGPVAPFQKSLTATGVQGRFSLSRFVALSLALQLGSAHSVQC